MLQNTCKIFFIAIHTEDGSMFCHTSKRKLVDIQLKEDQKQVTRSEMRAMFHGNEHDCSLMRRKQVSPQKKKGEA